MKKKQKQEMIFKFQTNKWNKLDKRKQDKALLFMHRVLVELERHRKVGYSDEFWAQYPY